MIDAINVLIIIDTVCILAITIKTFISKDGYRKGVEDGIKYSMAFLNKLFNDTVEYIKKDKKNSDEWNDICSKFFILLNRYVNK